MNAFQGANGDVAVRMFNRDQAWLGRMLELVMRAINTRQNPAVCFQLLDELFAVHGGNDIRPSLIVITDPPNLPYQPFASERVGWP